MIHPYIFAGIIILIYVLLWFVIAQIIKDNSIIDLAWAMGFVVVAWSVFWFYGYPNGIFIPIIVTIYGLRLSIYLFIRNRGNGEDWRYAKWRRDWGKKAVIRAFYRIFLLQGMMMWIIALPLLQLKNNLSITHQNIFLYVGFALWLLGFLWESIGDWQLARFKSQAANKGKIMRSGLWAYSRHPNYFGEILLWWGIFILSLPYGHWWISIISPLVLTFLLNRVSGVPMLEAKYKDHPEYQDYIKHTNALIPKLF